MVDGVYYESKRVGYLCVVWIRIMEFLVIGKWKGKWMGKRVKSLIFVWNIFLNIDLIVSFLRFDIKVGNYCFCDVWFFIFFWNGNGIKDVYFRSLL